MTRKQRRLTLIGAGLGMLALATGLILWALTLEGATAFFNTPSEVAEKLAKKQLAPGKAFRLGGLVKAGSYVRGEGFSARFEVTDGNNAIKVAYRGRENLPDLFREGQDVIAYGSLDADGVFQTDSVLTKHDENYIPREVADRLKREGLWREGGQQKARTP